MTQPTEDNDPEKIEALFKAYRQNPTIEEYVRLRKLYPGIYHDIATTGGLEFLFSQEKELRSYAIDPAIVASALDNDERAQGQLSLILLERLIERKALEKRGDSHVVSRKKAIGDSLVNYLIATMLDAADLCDGGFVGSDLIALIKHQLGITESEYEIKLRAHERRNTARFIAAQMVSNGEEPSFRSIARQMGVEPSTVMRWFPGKELIKEANDMASLIQNLKVLRKKGRVAR